MPMPTACALRCALPRLTATTAFRRRGGLRVPTSIDTGAGALCSVLWQQRRHVIIQGGAGNSFQKKKEAGAPTTGLDFVEGVTASPPAASSSTDADSTDSTTSPPAPSTVSDVTSPQQRQKDAPVAANANANQPPPIAYYDNSPKRATGLWKVEELSDDARKTVSFRRIDEVESEIATSLEARDNALVAVDDEEKWKNKLMFVHKFKKTPKHLTWKELGQEIECLDCVIDLDDHRPEEVFTMTFFFLNRKLGTRDIVWTTRNDVAASEGFTDLLAACGSCLGRSDVHRTIRFDDGVGATRELCIRKNSRYTSEVVLSFRPLVTYDLHQRSEQTDSWESEMEAQGMSTWGYHPSLTDPEYRDTADPVGTYHLTLSAHAFSFVMLRAIERLITRPLKDFYRPSQVMRTVRTQTAEDIGFTAAVRGWLGCDEKKFQHYNPLEAIQEHWLGNDAPFSITAIVNKLREMCYLKPENPEYVSWLSVRQRESAIAVRNVRAKLLGAGASPLFVPLSHNATVNQLLPRDQRRNLKTSISVGGLLGMPDETRRLGELKHITGVERITPSPSTEPLSSYDRATSPSRKSRGPVDASTDPPQQQQA